MVSQHNGVLLKRKLWSARSIPHIFGSVTERNQSLSATRQPRSQPQEFRLPMRTFDLQKNLKNLPDYLVGECKLPKELIERLARSPHIALYAGFGAKYSDYIVFLCRDHCMPPTTSSPSVSQPSPPGRPTDRGTPTVDLPLPKSVTARVRCAFAQKRGLVPCRRRARCTGRHRSADRQADGPIRRNRYP